MPGKDSALDVGVLGLDGFGDSPEPAPNRPCLS